MMFVMLTSLMNEWETIHVFKLQRNLFTAYSELCNINVDICKCESFRLFLFCYDSVSNTYMPYTDN